MSDNQTPMIPTTPAPESKKWGSALIFFGLVSLVGFIWLVYSLFKITDHLENVNRLEVSAVNIVKSVNDATFSRDFEVSKSAYAKLAGDIQTYETSLKNLQGNALMGNAGAFNALQQEWQTKKPSADYVLEHQNNINQLQDFKQQIKDAITQMQEQYLQVTDQAMMVRMPSATLKEIQSQIIRLERMNEELEALTSSTEASADVFKKHTTEFNEILTRQIASFGQASPALQSIKSTYEQMIAPVMGQLDDLSNPALQSLQHAQSLSDLATTTQDKLAEVDRGIITQKSILIPALLSLVGLLLSLYALAKLFKMRSRTERLITERESLRQRQELETEVEMVRRENDRIQKMEREKENSQVAILRLLDELADLAEGDLTTRATVTEDFTGAIADSVNLAIDQLRELVLAINYTADKVAKSSKQTQETAIELSESSQAQAHQIAGVSAAISQMVVSIEEVSKNADESDQVAKDSVGIAHNGVEVVHRSIEGMNIIRDQIQETSKRIKRLGESSQEIGNIINLINDIAEQTNILALNAAIQASMAGEAGRGFAVVADEVQRLAERSAAATRQIEILVRTIQADTNEAVASMESTTAEVVRGTKLAKDAGEALDKVQTVSHRLSDLIQNISNRATQQSQSVTHISQAMRDIQEITEKTTRGTMSTARSVGELNEMSAQLQKSVSGFKLSHGN